MVVYNDAKWNLEKRFSDFAQLDSELDDHFKSNESVQVFTSRIVARFFRSYSMVSFKRAKFVPCKLFLRDENHDRRNNPTL